MTYTELLQQLTSISFRGMKLGLENMHKLDAKLQFPSRAFASIHVGGSNGKGSVCTKIATALQASGKRVGLYTSPHIATFRERIRINGAMISEEEVSIGLKTLFALLEETHIPATFFEVTTLLAFLHFATQKVDIAVLEVGLGGRLDATNIVLPSLSIITSISLEHTDLLGNTLESIAKEKAGIIKPHVPILTGPRTPQEPISTIASELKSPHIKTTGTFSTFEEENRATSKRAMEHLQLPSHSIQKGLEALPPCRMQEINQRVILDVAHNPDGLQQLFKSLRAKYPNKRYRVVCGLSKNKDLSGCLANLTQNASFLHLTEAKNPRAASALELENLLIGFSNYAVNPDVSACVKDALAAAAPDELIVICGTFFIMAEARKALGVIDPTDPALISEKL